MFACTVDMMHFPTRPSSISEERRRATLLSSLSSNDFGDTLVSSTSYPWHITVSDSNVLSCCTSEVAMKWREGYDYKYSHSIPLVAISQKTVRGSSQE